MRPSSWHALAAQLALFLFASSLLPARRAQHRGFDIAPSTALAQSAPGLPSGLVAPTTPFENHESHAPIVTVSRQLSTIAAAQLVNGELSLSYRVKNQRPEKLSSVLLKTTLGEHVTLLAATPAPTSTDGGALAWIVPELAAYEERAVELRVRVNDVTLPSLDSGAEVYADYKARKVSASAVPAFLVTGTIAPELLACTIDADCSDPIVVAKAAELGNDPSALFAFVRDGIAYDAYSGSLRGARGTLWSRAGNAVDKASLLIALLRASGIPARYAAGQLAAARAQALIGSMFDANRPSLGSYPEDVEEFADPLNDVSALADASAHVWAEALVAGSFVPADPTFASSAWGDTQAAPTTTFAEVPDARRHKFNVKVRAELLNTLFSGGVPSRRTALDHTFNAVELVGKPITLSHLISSTGQSGFVFFNRQHTYTPLLIINDGVGDPAQDRVVPGTSYQELYSNFAGMNDVLTGVFVELTSTTPAGASTSHVRTIYDRLGYASRKFGGAADFPDDLGERRAFEPTDAYTMLVGGSAIDENAWVPHAQAMRVMEPGVRRALSTYDTSNSDEDLIALEAALRPVNRVQTAVALLTHAAASDKFLPDLKKSLGVAAYFDKCRVLVAHASANERGHSLSIDLRENTPRVLVGAGEPARMAAVFQSLRGLFEGSLESTVMRQMTGVEVADTLTVIDQAYAAGVPFEALVSGDEQLVDNLSVSPQARGRILEALARGKVVFTPTASVTIGQRETVGWLEIDPQRGELIPVMEDGGHQALVGYAGLLSDNGLKKIAWLVIGIGHGIADGTFTFLASVLENVHTKPIDQVLKDAKAAVIDRAVNKAISEGIGIAISSNAKKQLLKAAQCFIKATPADAANGGSIGKIETEPDKFVPCLVTRMIDAGILDPLWKQTTGKGWYKWGVVAGMVGLAGWFEYSLNIDPEILPFRVTAFAREGVPALGEAAFGATVAAGSYTLSAEERNLAGVRSGSTRDSFFSSNAVYRVQPGALTFGAFSTPLSSDQLLVRGETVRLNGTPVREGATLVGASGSLSLTPQAPLYTFAASGNATQVIYPNQSQYDVQVAIGGSVSFEVDVATSFADDYRIDVEAPRGWAASVNGNVVTVSPKPGSVPAEYPLYVTVRSTMRPELTVGYTVDVTLKTSVPGVRSEVVRDPLFTVAVAQAQLASAFRARITNTGPAEDTFELSFPALPAGFEVVSSTNAVTLAAGESAELGYHFVPMGPLPPPGSAAQYSVEVASLLHPEVSNTHAQTFVVPEVHELDLTVSPQSLAGAPGAQLTSRVTFAARGNVGEAFTITTQLPTGATLSGLPNQLALAAGEQRSFDVSVAVAASASLNRELELEVVADLCSGAASCPAFPRTRSGFLSVAVRSAGVAGVVAASNAALDAGFQDLAYELEALADVLVELELTPGSSAACDAVVRAAVDLRKLVATHAVLLPLREDFASLEAAAVSCTPTQVQAEVAALGPTLTTNLIEYRDYNLSASLSGARQVVVRGGSTTATLSLANVGQKSVTVALASTSSDDLSVSFERNGFTLAPGASSNVAVALSTEEEGQLPFNLTVQAQEGDTVRSFSGSIVSSNEPFNVTLVDTAPRLIQPGDTFQVFAHIANVANVASTVDAITQIRDANDVVKYVSTPATALTLPAGNRPDPYTLDAVDTTGWQSGAYQITVTLNHPASGTALGEGNATIHLGTPVHGFASVSPLLVPPGSAQVRTHIDVQRLVAGSGTNLGFTPTALNQDRINWAAQSRGATLTAPGWSNTALLLDGLGTGSETYTSSTVSNTNALSIDLSQIRSIDEVEFTLWNGDARFFRYRLEGSRDGTTFTVLKDAAVGEWRGKQRITFAATELRYIRLYGLHSSANASFHLIEELRAVGPLVGTPVATRTVVLDAIANGGANYTRGQRVELNAGIYEVRYEGGALSQYASDTDNGGKSWVIRHNVEIPSAHKSYHPHWVGPSLTAYNTAAAAEADNRGATFLVHMPIHGDAIFWFDDGGPTDNRGSLTLSLRQISGANGSLLARVRDAMTRAVTWQQRELAAWDNWGVNGASACYGCHIQSQGMAGLAQSRRKLPDLPIHHSIFDVARQSFRGWQDQAGFVSPRHGGSHRTTQTSLWAWSTSYFSDDDYHSLAGPVANGFDYLFTRQGTTGWDYDHDDVDVYSDGQPSATHTAGNIRALARYLNSSADERPLHQPQPANPSEIYFADAEPNAVDIQLGGLSGVTGIQLRITDTFANNKNFVINEVEFFNGQEKLVVSGTEASFSQTGFPIANTTNGVITGNGDGWAHSPRNVATQPALGLYKFASPVNVDRVRIHQRYDSSNHKIRRFIVSQTNAAAPTLASAFTPVMPVSVVNGLDAQVVLERLRRAADTFLAPAWPFTRNVRTAAQSLLGLHDALPFLEESKRAAAQAKIREIELWLRGQQFAGGWRKHDRMTSGPQPFQSAQALEALLTAASSSVDPAILDATEYLLNTQQKDGSWVSIDLERELAATTWVEIALPTLFELLGSLTFRVEHELPTDRVALRAGSGLPALAPESTPTSLVWRGLTRQTCEQLSVDLQLSNLEAGEVLPVSNGTTIEYASVEGSGSVALAPLNVAVKHILTVDPPERLVAPGATATYSATLENLLSTSDTFTLEVSGVPAGWLSLPPATAIAPGARTTLPIAINVPTHADLAQYPLTVHASSTLGARDAAGASLRVSGSAPPVVLEDDGVALEVFPAVASAGQGTPGRFTARVTNIGSFSDDFALTATLPAGASAQFETPVVRVEPGYGQAAYVDFTVLPPSGMSTSDLSFMVAATSIGTPSVRDTAQATLRILPLGVDVAITPPSGGAADSYVVTVTNTGSQADTFALALGGGVALGATALPATVALAAGASQQYDVTFSNLSVLSSGPALFGASAVSQTDTAVRDEASASVGIPPSFAFDATVTPADVALPALAAAEFGLLVTNMGNQEDAYRIEVTGVSGPATATFGGPLGGSSAIAEARLPAVAAGGFPLAVQLTAYGTAEVQLAVMSLTNGATETLTVTVRAADPNRAPIVDAGGPYSVKAGERAVLRATASDSDGPSPLALIWSFVSQPTGSNLTASDLTNASTNEVSFVPVVRGEYVLVVTANDGRASASDTAQVTATNNAPVADAGDDQNARAQELVVLDGTRSYDADGDQFTFAWSFEVRPAGSLAQLDDPFAPRPRFIPDLPGTYEIALTVDDSTASSTDTVLVNVAALNVAPNAAISAPHEVTVGELVSLDGSGSFDPDQGPQALTYLWSLLRVPTGSNVSNASLGNRSSSRASFMSDVAGEYELTLSVSDGQGQATASAIVVAQLSNLPPVADAGPDMAFERGVVLLSASRSYDPDQGPEPLRYSWRLVSVPDGSALESDDIADATQSDARFTPDVLGTYVVELGVFDGLAWSLDNLAVVVSTLRCDLNGDQTIDHFDVRELEARLKGNRAVGEIRVDFDCERVTVYTCKDLSNIVLEFDDGAIQRFEGLRGQVNTFAGSGSNAGAEIIGVWVKAGSNHSGDGPGYGERFDAAADVCELGGHQDTIAFNGAACCRVSARAGDPADFNQDACVTQVDVDGCKQRLTESTPEACNDGFDNDLDTQVDCADTTCLGVGLCAVVVNECLPRPASGGEWVELWNPAPIPVDVSGARVDDARNEARAVVIPNGSVVPAKGALVIPLVGNNLNDSGSDQCRLLSAGEREINALSYSAAPVGSSWARSPNATGAAAWRATPTRGAANP